MNAPFEEDAIEAGKAASDEFFAQMNRVRKEHFHAAQEGRRALDRLVDAMAMKTGQSYKVRALLYSIWNGSKPADVSELLAMDWDVRKDVCAVLLGFGYEDGPRGDKANNFFYDAMTGALKKAGLFDWFCEAGEVQ